MNDYDGFFESVFQGVVVALVATAIIWYFTQRHETNKRNGVAGPSTAAPYHARNYMPLVGNATIAAKGTPVGNNCCNIGFVGANCAIPIATDYLDCSPDYVPATSCANLGVPTPTPCCGGVIHRAEVSTTFPFGTRSRLSTTPLRIKLQQQITCNPNVDATISCAEVI